MIPAKTWWCLTLIFTIEEKKTKTRTEENLKWKLFMASVLCGICTVCVASSMMFWSQTTSMLSKVQYFPAELLFPTKQTPSVATSSSSASMLRTQVYSQLCTAEPSKSSWTYIPTEATGNAPPFITQERDQDFLTWLTLRRVTRYSRKWL